MKLSLVASVALFFGLLLVSVPEAQVGYSSNIGTSTSGGGSGGAGQGACPAGQVMIAVTNGAPPTCTASVTPGTVTTSSPFTFSQTWNNVATIFDTFHIDVNKTAYAEHSSLFEVTDVTNGSKYFSIQPELGSPADGVGVFVFNNGANSIANSKNFAIHSIAGEVVFGEGSGGAGATGLFSRFIDIGENWQSGAQVRLGTNNIALNQNSIIEWTNSDSPFSTVDTGFSRIATGSVAVGNGTAGDFTGNVVATLLQTKTVVAVASLPTCNGAAEGTHASVNNALTPVALANVAGGGAVHVSVYCNGTNWIVQ